MRGALLLLQLAVAVPAPAQQAPPSQPWPSGEVRRAQLSFEGRSTLGNFTGLTGTVQGAMTGGGSLAEVRGHVEAPVATLKTGNDRRDRDLVKTMDAAVYPNIRFELEGVTPDWERSDSAGVTLQGRFVIHGVARLERVPAVLVRSAEGIRVRADLGMNLHDYKIDRLTRLLVFSMNPDILVHLDILFGPTGS